MKFTLRFTAPVARHVPDNITEHYLGNQSIGMMASGYVVRQEADENCVGFQNQLVRMTVTAPNYLIRFELNVPFRNLSVSLGGLLRRVAIEFFLEYR